MVTREFPPRYYWLWHLAAMGVIDADYGSPPIALPAADKSALRAGVPQITGTRWDDYGTGGTAKVALIDTGTSRRHPNLAGRIDEALSIDLTTHRHGARHVAPLEAAVGPGTREVPHAFFTGLSLNGLDLNAGDTPDLSYLQGLVADFAASKGVIRHLAEPEETVASHGTGCAGLLVGHPALVPDSESVSVMIDGKGINPARNILPYFGVDPFSTLVSIRTSFESDPVQFILAFLYARHCKVDAIVLPRGLPDPVRSRLQPLQTGPTGTWADREADDLIARLAVPASGIDPGGVQVGHLAERGWNLLAQVIVAVSKRIPVLCAAGNDGESQVIYPANLAAADNGIVAVGAVTPEGYRAGYANYGAGLTLVMPSDDFEVLNRHQSRLDRTDPLITMHDFEVGARTKVPFCPLELATTDLPGVFGYDRGAAPWSSVNDPAENSDLGGGYYTAFGGTSGAACLAGGLVLLAQRLRNARGMTPLDGIAMKAALLRSATTDTMVLPGYRKLQGDAMNRDDEPTEPLAHFFGGGLPDARKLLRDVLTPAC